VMCWAQGNRENEPSTDSRRSHDVLQIRYVRAGRSLPSSAAKGLLGFLTTRALCHSEPLRSPQATASEESLLSNHQPSAYPAERCSNAIM